MAVVVAAAVVVVAAAATATAVNVCRDRFNTACKFNRVLHITMKEFNSRMYSGGIRMPEQDIVMFFYG